MASKLLKARLKSASRQEAKQSYSTKVNVGTSSKAMRSKSGSSSGNKAQVVTPHTFMAKFKSGSKMDRLTLVGGAQPSETTFTGLPWSVRRKDSKYNREAQLISAARRHGTYSYSYSELDDEDEHDGDGGLEERRQIQMMRTEQHQRNRLNLQRTGYNLDPLTLHHYRTDRPGPAVNLKPGLTKPVIAGEQQVVESLEAAKQAKTDERDSSDPYKDRLDNKVIHAYDQLTENSMRGYLEQSGFVPTISTELHELYRAMQKKRPGLTEHAPGAETPPAPDEDDPVIKLLGPEETAAAFASPKSPRTKKHEELIRIYGKKLASKMVHGELAFPPGFSMDDVVSKKRTPAPKVTMHTGGPEDFSMPVHEPHPNTFVNPKIRIPLSTRIKLIQKQLDEEKRLANPKMDAQTYERRRRALLNAAMKAYDTDVGKSTDELLVDLVDTPADRVLYHNITTDRIGQPEDFVHFGGNQTGPKSWHAPPGPAGTSTSHWGGGGLYSSPPSSTQSLKSGSIFGRHKQNATAVEPSAVNYFKGASVAGSVIRQLEADSPSHFDPPRHIILPTSTRFSKGRFVSQKTIRTREIAKQTLDTYSLTKQQQLESLQRPKEMRLIGKRSRN